MPAFYLEGPVQVGAVVPLPKDEAKHALKVLRMSVGEELCALDGQGGRFAAVLESVHGDSAEVRITEQLPSNEPGVKVTLYQGLPKADKLDFIVQKLTELGAGCIVPVKMERCVVKSDAKDGKKRQERLQRIACEAVKQCRRACEPEVIEPMTCKQCFARMKQHEIACERIVASAAPRTPSSSAKIKTGSRTILAAAPISTAVILTFVKPCAVTKAFMPSVSWTNIVPRA